MKISIFVALICPAHIISARDNYDAIKKDLDRSSKDGAFHLNEELQRKRKSPVFSAKDSLNLADNDVAKEILTEDEEDFLRFLQSETLSYAPSAAPSSRRTKAPVASTPAPTKAPTVAPTKAPTVAPTKAPVSPPTMAPVAPPTCVDSPLKFKLNGTAGLKRRGCIWVGRKADKLARRCAYKNVTTHCPQTCGQCDKLACVDSTKKFWIRRNDTRERTCNFVADRNSDIRCAHPGVTSTCRKTCNFTGC
jgi:hypothetical protein